MRYSTQRHPVLPSEIFARKIQHNPYVAHIYEYQDLILPHPTPTLFQERWQTICGSESKVHVEIGCGSGKYLHQLCERDPQAGILGFELRYKRLVQTARRLQKYHCLNALLLRERGEYLTDYLSPQSMDQLHINFPDPWPKKSHRKHRLLNESFLQAIYPLFRPGGALLFKTDHHEYFHSVVELIERLTLYHIEEHTTNLHHSDFRQSNILTEFEQLFIAKANPPIAYLKARVI